MHHCQFEYQIYQRPFRTPLRTHHGVWAVREGILLQLSQADGQQSWGEIAPLPDFGTETIAQALHFCQTLPAEINAETIAAIPDTLPACQFGFASAWEGFAPQPEPIDRLPVSQLLPTGKAALQAWQIPYQQGHRTFKWKIGVAAIAQELAWFEELVADLPADVHLRLDANGGLNWSTACQWLKTAADIAEFIEQPLPPDRFIDLLRLQERYPTPIALDESVATLPQLQECWKAGWRGVYVVKAAIGGAPDALREFCVNRSIDIVWSSVLETIVAQQFVEQRLIPTVSTTHRAVGFGTGHWFSDAWDTFTPQDLWRSLSKSSNLSVNTG